MLLFVCAAALLTPAKAEAIPYLVPPASPPAPTPAPSPPIPEAQPAAPGGTAPVETSNSAGAPSGDALPMSPAAKVHYDRGLDLFRSRDYAGAVRALEQGFAVEPRREFLFAEAQALRLAGDCARAIPLYRRFIDSGPQPVQAQAARLSIDRCAPERSAPTPAPAPPRADEPRIWWRDPWALTSAGLGVVAVGIGSAAWFASERYVDDAQSARTTTLNQYDRLWDLATSRRRLAIAGLAGGAGLLAAGAARALWVYRHRAPPEPAPTTAGLSFWPRADGGGTLLWEGRF